VRRESLEFNSGECQKLQDVNKLILDIMTVVSQVILRADDELRYPSSGELKSIGEFLQTGTQRVRIAETLAENERKIVDKASKELWKKRPDFISPGGNAYGSRERAQCLRDYGWYLRLVTYGILAGDKEPIESIGIIGAKECTILLAFLFLEWWKQFVA